MVAFGLTKGKVWWCGRVVVWVCGCVGVVRRAWWPCDLCGSARGRAPACRPAVCPCCWHNAPVTAVWRAIRHAARAQHADCGAPPAPPPATHPRAPSRAPTRRALERRSVDRVQPRPGHCGLCRSREEPRAVEACGVELTRACGGVVGFVEGWEKPGSSGVGEGLLHAASRPRSREQHAPSGTGSGGTHGDFPCALRSLSPRAKPPGPCCCRSPVKDHAPPSQTSTQLWLLKRSRPLLLPGLLPPLLLLPLLPPLPPPEPPPALLPPLVPPPPRAWLWARASGQLGMPARALGAHACSE